MKYEQLKKMVLECIEKSGSNGLYFEEIQEETKIKKLLLKGILNRLRKKEKIYHYLTTNKWRLIEYKTDIEKMSMRWSAG